MSDTDPIINFTYIAGAEVRYARHRTLPPPAHPYGTIGKGPRRQRLASKAYDALTAAITELGEIHPWGAPRYIVSAGAMVPQSDRRGADDPHVRGLAYDIDAIWWEGAGRRIITLDAPKQWTHYIAIQCILARWFGTVLGYDCNRAHRDHWHCDVTRPVVFDASSRMDVVLLQRALSEVWGSYIVVDGKYGPKTGEAWLVGAGVALDWRDWLLATAKRGLEGL